MPDTLDLIIRLLVAGAMGGAIGFEREMRAKEAGIRTHFLVAVGSALFMIISQWGFAGAERFDASRIAAQVVSGIGFIGAGTIIFQKNVVRGLTTAAGLWVTAAIGLACGSAMYKEAGAVVVMVILCLEAIHILLNRFGEKAINVSFSSYSKETLMKGIDFLRERRMEIDSYQLDRIQGEKGLKYKVELSMKVRREDYVNRIYSLLSALDGVTIESIE